MNRPLLGFAGLIAAGGVAGGVYVALPGGGEEEVLQSVPTATAAATEAPTVAPTTAVTLTYTDPTYGYSFQYPAKWVLSPAKEGSVVTLYSYDPSTVAPEAAGMPVPADKLKVEFKVQDNPEGLSLEAWIADRRASGAPVVVATRSAITVDDTDGIVETVEGAEGGFSQQQFFLTGRNVYVVVMYPADSLLSTEFAAILTSLTFPPTQ